MTTILENLNLIPPPNSLIPPKPEPELVKSEDPRTRPTVLRLTKPQIKALIQDYQSGLTLQQLATKYHIHPQTAAAHLQRNGIKRRKAKKLDQTDIAYAIRRYNTGDSLQTIATELGSSRNAVKHHLEKAGVPIRPRPGS